MDWVIFNLVLDNSSILVDPDLKLEWGLSVITSSICQYSDFYTDWFARWTPHIGVPVGVDIARQGSYRKSWEWAAILEGIQSRGKMQEGLRGLGFAVGQEPLSSVIAARGPSILASDFPDKSLWSISNEQAESLESLFWPGEISRELFDDRVAFTPIDMADLSSVPKNEFDFVWSSCALEHIG